MGQPGYDVLFKVRGYDVLFKVRKFLDLIVPLSRNITHRRMLVLMKP